MNGRTLILLVVAIVIAVIAAVIVKNRSPSSGGEGGPKILVAMSDIAAGGFVRSDKDLSWVDWPAGNISPSFITPDAHKIEEFNGGVARHSISVGVPVTEESIVRVNEGGFMSAVLVPGKRAVSIAVNSTSGNAGFIFPGDRVDLLLTHKVPVKDATSGGDVLASETFIEDVRVLAIDQMLDNPDNKAVVAKTITLEVSPKQAEMINVAASLGSISLSLRSLSNNKVSDTKAPDAKAADPKTVDVKAPSGAAPIAVEKPVEAAPVFVAPNTAAEPHTRGENYSTNDDVSKLMGNKSDVHSKVSVYHGNTTEQIDFHQGQK